jgi:hypothetical protein
MDLEVDRAGEMVQGANRLLSTAIFDGSAEDPSFASLGRTFLRLVDHATARRDCNVIRRLVA